MTNDKATEIKATQSRLMELVVSLRKKENGLRSKISTEQDEQEKAARRHDFYTKLSTNIDSKRHEAESRLRSAEVALEEVNAEAESIEELRGKLQPELADVIAKNEAAVTLELDRLNTLLTTSNNEISANKRACSNDEQRILELTKLIESYTAECNEIRRQIDARSTDLSSLPQPESFAEELSAIKTSIVSIKQETEEVETKKKRIGIEIDLQTLRKDELEKLKENDELILSQELTQVQIQRQEYDNNVKLLGQERVEQHSLASSRVEIELNTAIEQDGIKHNTNFLTSVDKRSFNIAKQALSKQELAAAKIREMIPIMQAKLTDLQYQLSIYQSDLGALEREQLNLQTKVDHAVAKHLGQETVDEQLRLEVDNSLSLIAIKELELDQMRAKEKSSSLVLTITKEKQSSIRRKIEEVQHIQHKVEGSIRLQQLIEIDLTKKHKDATSKAKELAELCSLIENEKLETTRLIKTSNESCQHIKKKIDTLTTELRTHVLERDAKIDTLRLLKKDIEASTAGRAANRRHKSINWTFCRVLMEEIANAEARFEKLKDTLSLARKEVGRIQSMNESAITAKKSVTEQLAVKKDELLFLYHSNAVYAETLKRGEFVCQQLEEETKNVKLKVSSVILSSYAHNIFLLTLSNFIESL